MDATPAEGAAATSRSRAIGRDRVCALWPECDYRTVRNIIFIDVAGERTWLYQDWSRVAARLAGPCCWPSCSLSYARPATDPRKREGTAITTWGRSPPRRKARKTPQVLVGIPWSGSR